MNHLQKIFLVTSLALASSVVPNSTAGVELSVGVVVKAPPPAPRAEVIVGRPSPRHVWVSGFWHWEAGRHVWVAGHWELPPREHVVYVPAHWDQHPDGYVFVAGEWRDGPASASVEATTVTAETIVTQAPPPPPAEQVGQPPSPGSVWLPGYWRWGTNAYEWTPGQWAQPPTPTSRYVGPHWEARDNGFAFCPGYWEQGVAQPSSPAPVIVTEAPPPLVHEVIVEQPSRYHIWIQGHWYWSAGRYVWAPGHWERPPHRHAVYVPAHWDHRGHGYVLIEGYWR